MTGARLLVLALTVLASGCARRPVIGVVLPETGSAAVYGAAVKSGVALAFAERPASLAVELEYRDSGSDPVRAATLTQALLEQGALLVVGGVTTAEAKAMLPVADAAQRVLISPSASTPELSGRSRYFFRVYPSDEHEGVRAAEYLTHSARVRRVLVVQEDNDYARGLLAVFVTELRERAGEVLATVRLEDKDWRRALRSRLAAADAVYVCGYGDAIVSVLTELRGARYAGVVCTASALYAAVLLDRAGGAAEGVVFPLPAVSPSRPGSAGQRFRDAYHAAYGMSPDVWAAHGHDALLAALAALRRLEGRPPGGRAEVLHGLAGVQGATGPLAFDERGDIRHSIRMHRVRGVHVVDAEPDAGPGGAAS